MQRQSNAILRSFVLVGLFLSALNITYGQVRPDTHSATQSPIKVKTTLVMIPTVVTEKSGKRVEDLREEDFEVLRDGQVQKIGFFKHVLTKAELMKAAATPPDAATNAVEGVNDRLTIFVVDFLNSSLNEQKTAYVQLLDFLTKAVDVREPLCLLAIDANGVELIHDFTTDPAVLVKALKNLKETSSDKDKPQRNPDEELFRLTQGWHSKSPTRNAAALQARIKALDLYAKQADISKQERVAITLEALREIGEAFAGIPGRKSMVWATGGFPFEIDRVSQFGYDDKRLMPAYEAAWRALNHANIAVYPLDEGELVNPAYVNAGIGKPTPEHVALDMHIANMQRFAEVTGGKFCDRGEDAASCFREAANDSSDYYLIGIYENSEDSEPGWRKLQVKVHRAEYQIRSRTGYYVAGPQNDDEKAREDMEVALSSPVNYTAIPIGVRWSVSKVAAEDAKKRIDFMYVLAPGVTTLDDADKNHISLEFAALARDGKGRPMGTFSKVVEGHLAEEMAAKIRTEGLKFPGSMELPPGEYTIIFVTRDNLSRLVGSVSSEITVP